MGVVQKIANREERLHQALVLRLMHPYNTPSQHSVYLFFGN